MTQRVTHRWTSGDHYEPFVGRWSRLVAETFLTWLDPAPGLAWLDVGCGTGALTEAIAKNYLPKRLAGIDPSVGFLEFARRQLGAYAVELQPADAGNLPFAEAEFDRVVSGLVLNFVPDPRRAAAEMVRVTRPGGKVAVYVWDYAGKMEMMRYFWEAAAELDARGGELDEGKRFPICQPEALERLFTAAGLLEVGIRPIDIPMRFRDFDDFWTPFLGGQGPAPAYCMSLSEDARANLRERLQKTLPARADGSIQLTARAWAVRGHASRSGHS
jgi:SAM-dependent methyltransferase